MSALTVVSENFEGATIGYYTSGNAITGSIFSVIGTNAAIDITGPGDPYAFQCAAPEASGKCLDTTGGGANGRGDIEMTNAFFFGANSYTLSIGMRQWDEPNGAGPQTATIQVSLGSLLSPTTYSYTLDGTNNGVVVIPFTVAVGTNAKLRIVDISGTGAFAGAIIDNISIDTAAGIPEPSTYALFAAGLSALAFARRKR